jgi:hypothetical protein
LVVYIISITTLGHNNWEAKYFINVLNALPKPHSIVIGLNASTLNSVIKNSNLAEKLKKDRIDIKEFDKYPNILIDTPKLNTLISIYIGKLKHNNVSLEEVRWFPDSVNELGKDEITLTPRSLEVNYHGEKPDFVDKLEKIAQKAQVNYSIKGCGESIERTFQAKR